MRAQPKRTAEHLLPTYRRFRAAENNKGQPSRKAPLAGRGDLRAVTRDGASVGPYLTGRHHRELRVVLMNGWKPKLEVRSSWEEAACPDIVMSIHMRNLSRRRALRVCLQRRPASAAVAAN